MLSGFIAGPVPEVHGGDDGQVAGTKLTDDGVDNHSVQLGPLISRVAACASAQQRRCMLEGQLSIVAGATAAAIVLRRSLGDGKMPHVFVRPSGSSVALASVWLGLGMAISVFAALAGNAVVIRGTGWILIPAVLLTTPRFVFLRSLRGALQLWPAFWPRRLPIRAGARYELKRRWYPKGNDGLRFVVCSGNSRAEIRSLIATSSSELEQNHRRLKQALDHAGRA
jgi:hypothetical protein